MSEDTFTPCMGTLAVILEHYGYEHHGYMQSEVWTLALECSEPRCWWHLDDDANRLTIVTPAFLAEQQADHDAFATRYVGGAA